MRGVLADLEKFGYQPQGIAAFKHPDVVRAIQSGTYGRIAVAYIDWSSLPFSRLIIDWRIIGDKASADAFADTLLRAPFTSDRAPRSARRWSSPPAADRNEHHRGTQRSIDVSGDGPNNTGPPVHQVRDEIAAKRITINGLPFVSTGEYSQGDWGNYYGELENYYVKLRYWRRACICDPGQGLSGIRRSRPAKAGARNFRSDPPPSPIIKTAVAPNAWPPLTPLRPPPPARGGTTENCGRGLGFVGRTTTSAVR